MTELPTNCILDKGKTGAGGTELAINQSGHMIIAMPYTNLVKNKENPVSETLKRRKHHIIGVYEGVSKEDIIEWAKTHNPIKIATTYDSLPRVIDALKEASVDVYNEVGLLVDEWQTLFNAYDFRNDAVRRLLSEAPKFKSCTYMSATPIEREYILEELVGIPMVDVLWKNTEQVRVQTHRVDKPLDMVAYTCMDFISNSHKGNAHIFVNSVEFIAKVIDKANLQPSQVKVVCSASRDSLVRNKAKLGTNFPISEPADPVKKINFYTSTAFEGCDIYDEQGRIFIVSDSHKKHTLIDISTTFPQICGRLRNSKYRTDIIHIYPKQKADKEVSLEEYIQSTWKIFTESEQHAKVINALPLDTRKYCIDRITLFDDRYVRIEDYKIIVDKNFAKRDIINYKVQNHVYSTSVSVEEELRNNGFDISVSQEWIVTSLASNPKAKQSFREVFDLYCQLKAAQPMYSLEKPNYNIEIIEKSRPIVKQVYDELGQAEVIRLDYNLTNIKRELVKTKNLSNEIKAFKIAEQTFVKGEAILVSDVKKQLQAIYDTLGIQHKAKATDLSM